jgi:hypothetical protein
MPTHFEATPWEVEAARRREIFATELDAARTIAHDTDRPAPPKSRLPGRVVAWIARLGSPTEGAPAKSES